MRAEHRCEYRSAITCHGVLSMWFFVLTLDQEGSHLRTQKSPHLGTQRLTCAHMHVAALEWHLPPPTFALGARVAHKSHAPLEWHLPPLNFALGARVAHKSHAPLEWHLPPLKCTLAWLTKGMHRWNGHMSCWHLKECAGAHSSRGFSSFQPARLQARRFPRAQAIRFPRAQASAMPS